MSLTAYSQLDHYTQAMNSIPNNDDIQKALEYICDNYFNLLYTLKHDDNPIALELIKKLKQDDNRNISDSPDTYLDSIKSILREEDFQESLENLAASYRSSSRKYGVAAFLSCAAFILSPFILVNAHPLVTTACFIALILLSTLLAMLSANNSKACQNLENGLQTLKDMPKNSDYSNLTFFNNQVLKQQVKEAYDKLVARG